jgi:hypothetical protein
MSDEATVPPALNRLAVVGVVVAALVAAGALFALPALRNAGLSFRAGFVLVSGVEFVAALVSGYSALRLYERRGD